MSLITRCINAVRAFRNSTSVDLNSEELLEWLGIKTGSGNIQEITYYTCLKMLSETIAKLPIKYYQKTDEGNIQAKPDNTSYVLSVRPNHIMTSTTFWSSVELNRNHYGNAYVLIRKKEIKEGRYTIGTELEEMWILRSDRVKVLIDDRGIFNQKGRIYYQYSDEYDGKVYFYNEEDIMHFKSFNTFNGIVGKSVRETLKETIDGAAESQKFMNNLYKEGLTASAVMQYTGDLDETNMKKLQKKYSSFLTGSKNAGKIVPVPLGIQLQPLNLSLVDAQFFELKKYSALQIAGAIGIKPNQINNYEKSSYSNSEMQNLSFLVDTMQFILKQYEEEINYKSIDSIKIKNGYFFKFNEKSILRTDSKSQMESLSKAVNNGIYTPNEARQYLDKPCKKGGDVLIVNGNYIPLTRVGDQYQGGNENA